MSIEIDQFHGVFFDESREHLQRMEQELMDLDLASPDAEQLNSIFRAAHSIKGGSGIFGFEALIGLTHIMENLLDKARKGTTKLNDNIVNVLLETVDLLKVTVDAYQGQQTPDQLSIDQGIKKLEAAIGQEDLNDKPSQSNQDDSFGLFAEEETAEEIEGFGFFDVPEQKSVEEEQGFGFFETPEQKSDTPDEGFGFFDQSEIETVKAANTSPKQSTVKKVEEKSKAVTPTLESSSIRVDTGKIDNLVNLVGELVITQSMLAMLGLQATGPLKVKQNLALQELQRNTREIQESVMSMRMLPMSVTFSRFPRVVRDLSNKLGKSVDLIIEGGATEIDKSMIEKLVDPLTHLVRNSIGHGIETKEDRVAVGKNETGSVILRAEQKGSSIQISIIDDGAGLNRQRILAKAAENNIQYDPDMPDNEVWNLIFEAGFSTATEVTDVSGRGVGMDVVRRNIEAIGGRIEITSSAGIGSSFCIQLPLTLAIVDGMCVSVGEQIFVVPLVNIIESIQPSEKQIKSISNDSVLWIREKYWPLVRLHKELKIDNGIANPNDGIVVLIESSNKRFGLLVDSLVGQQQVVIKSLEKHYKRVSGIAGATIMGDGGVAMILDVESLADLAKSANTEFANV